VVAFTGDEALELSRDETPSVAILDVNVEIAERLVISPKTVGTHLERILGKLGARSRAQAVAIAYRDALVPIGS
jgi:FixJ family two-component response regulator